ncbi:MAG: F0F1 ATP synthase subunit delta [Pseudomonadales bacterium]|nr:F0F1 ATP synthase subunit delta [Pseudomonadales bacterium]
MADAELATIARPYARAVFSKALDEDGGLENWSRMLGLLALTVANDRVKAALDDPRLTTADEAATLVGILEGELSGNGRNFVSVLAEYGRLMLLPRIWELYELLKANHEQTLDVEVVSAFEVTDEEKEKLMSSLKRKLQREINIDARVEQSLLGGVIIRAEDTVIDSSVRGKLEKLSQALH